MSILKSRLHGLTQMIKNHGGYFITTFINSSLPLLLLPILTRYLSPAEYANIALFNFYIAISNSLAGTSVPTVISKNFFDKPKEYIAKIVGNSIRVVFVFSFIISLLMFLLYDYIGEYLDLPLIWLVLIPWGSFFYILLSIALSIHRNEKKVLIFSYHKIFNTAINILVSLFLVVVLLWGWQGRLTGVLVSYAVSAVGALYYLIKNNYLDFSYSKKVIKNILNTIVPLIANAFQSVIISRVGFFFMQLYFTKELLGIYSIAFQISYFVHLLFITISFSWNPFVYEQVSNPKKLNLIRLTRVLYLISFILFAGGVFVSLFSGFILRVFTTEEYYGAVEFITILSAGVFFNGLYVFLLPILIKKEKQKSISVISLVNMIIMLGLNVLFINLFGYIGIAYAFTATYFLMFVPIAIISQKEFPLPLLKALNFKSTLK